MVSPCEFLCVFVCHDICPDDSSMKDWYHTHNILLIYSCRCVVLHVMCYVHAHDVIDDFTRYQSRSYLEIPITERLANRYCHCLWFRAHDSRYIQIFGFSLGLQDRQLLKFEIVFRKFHVLYIIAFIRLRI